MVALAGVSLDVAPAEVVYLLGPSGCGKTTLVRIAAGIERPTRGRVLINGQEASAPNRFVLPEERNVGLMFQDFGATPWCSIATPSTCLWLGSFSRSTRSRGAWKVARYARPFGAFAVPDLGETWVRPG